MRRRSARTSGRDRHWHFHAIARQKLVLAHISPIKNPIPQWCDDAARPPASNASPCSMRPLGNAASATDLLPAAIPGSIADLRLPALGRADRGDRWRIERRQQRQSEWANGRRTHGRHVDGTAAQRLHLAVHAPARAAGPGGRAQHEHGDGDEQCAAGWAKARETRHRDPMVSPMRAVATRDADHRFGPRGHAAIEARRPVDGPACARLCPPCGSQVTPPPPPPRRAPP